MIIIIIIINTLFSEGNSWSVYYNGTEQWPTYLIWGLLLIMKWNIIDYIFGGWGWKWWQDIDKPNNSINTCILCI